MTLSDSQWNRFDSIQKIRLKHWTKKYGDDKHDIIYRLGVAMFKMLMIFSALRMKASNDITIRTIRCDDSDLELVIELSEVLFYHVIAISNSLGVSDQRNNLANR